MSSGASRVVRILEAVDEWIRVSGSLIIVDEACPSIIGCELQVLIWFIILPLIDALLQLVHEIWAVVLAFVKVN